MAIFTSCPASPPTTSTTCGIGGEGEIEDPGRSGELALRAGWPSMFRAYLDQDERYQQSFVDGW